MVTLPTEVSKATRVNPKKIIIFSQVKSGKTEAASRLKDNLILDLEDGSGFVDAMKINVLDISKKENISPLKALGAVIAKIRESNEAKKGYTYKYITIDTISALEDVFALEMALKLYKDTVQGRNFQGDDVRKLGNGNGWQFLREAVQIILAELEALCDTLIVLGHVREKLIDSNEEGMTQKGLDLSGKLASIVCSTSDAIAYLYRKDNQTIANFQPSESLTVGARPLHLKGKKIVLLESDEQGNITDHWDKIFV